MGAVPAYRATGLRRVALDGVQPPDTHSDRRGGELGDVTNTGTMRDQHRPRLARAID